ncbi:L-rhamnose mutarotase [Flagellimonas sp. CMM7]|uniref:L-rhamnose mutarotase n=1 Tax=Flagellimonas sp. CMM7 TaxID=2654676 RepID=UPI0013D29C6A|nr:L-rhamnose mutarotase [Flagellimonas sp. CMM7]UII78729.1 L-rhamnose mutarotase [Flagellimonas sp. CMM7]
MKTKRIAFKMFLKPGMVEEYHRRHNQICPEMLKLLRKQGVGQFSIFLDEETQTLFAYQQVIGDTNSQDLGNNPIVRKWWEYMADIMETNQDNSPKSIPLKELFYME